MLQLIGHEGRFSILLFSAILWPLAVPCSSPGGEPIYDVNIYVGTRFPVNTLL